jgi:hypothetical protein
LSENDPDSHGAIMPSFVAVLGAALALIAFKGDVRLI